MGRINSTRGLREEIKRGVYASGYEISREEIVDSLIKIEGCMDDVVSELRDLISQVRNLRSEIDECIQLSSSYLENRDYDALEVMISNIGKISCDMYEVIEKLDVGMDNINN